MQFAPRAFGARTCPPSHCDEARVKSDVYTGGIPKSASRPDGTIFVTLLSPDGIQHDS
jgi:hypothetical protein